MTNGTNVTFRNAIVRAGKMIQFKYRSDGRELAEILRSNEPLGLSERELLAQLVTGEWCNTAGGQTNTYADIMFAVTVSKYFKHRTETDNIKKTAVYAECFEKFKVAESTVRKYIKLHEDRLADGINDIPEKLISIGNSPKKDTPE